jgi:hypothetical protein
MAYPSECNGSGSDTGAPSGAPTRCVCGIEVQNPGQSCPSVRWLPWWEFNRLHASECIDCLKPFVRARLDWVTCLKCRLAAAPRPTRLEMQGSLAGAQVVGSYRADGAALEGRSCDRCGGGRKLGPGHTVSAGVHELLCSVCWWGYARGDAA